MQPSSPEGFIKVPRRLIASALSTERKWGLVWLMAQASYTARNIGSVTLRIGETPVLSLTSLETNLGFSRKSARNFVEYVLSPRCVEETGVRVRIGQRIKGHVSGHEGGHVTGHTYLIGISRDALGEGHVSGHEGGHVTGHVDKKKVRRREEETDMGHEVARVRHEYEPDFDAAWEASPYRLGNNPKLAAAKMWRARRKEGVPLEVLHDATVRYAAFCDATNLTGTAHVMQMATFFGPNRPFEQEWEVPAIHSNGNGKSRWR